jgi:hypothetical protein
MFLYLRGNLSSTSTERNSAHDSPPRGGSGAQWLQLKTATSQALGVNLRKKAGVDPKLVAVVARALLGESTRNDIKDHKDIAFNGAWDSEVIAEVTKLNQRLQKSPHAAAITKAQAGRSPTPILRKRGDKKTPPKKASIDESANKETEIPSESDSEEGGIVFAGKKKVTLDSLAAMVSKGFSGVSSRLDDTDGAVKSMAERMDKIEDDMRDLKRKRDGSAEQNKIEGISELKQGPSSDSLFGEFFNAASTHSAAKKARVQTASAGNQGVPNRETEGHFAELNDPDHPVIEAEELKAQIKAFINDTKVTDDADIQKKKTETLMTKIDNMSLGELQSLSDKGPPDWLRNMTGQTGSGRSAGKAFISIPKPNRSVPAGGFVWPGDFTEADELSVQGILDEAAGLDKSMVMSVDGKGHFKMSASKQKYTIKNFMQYLLACNKFEQFARHSRSVRHLGSPLHFLHHSSYVARLTGYAEKFHLRYVLEFDVKFRKQVYDSLLTGWLDPAQALFQETFIVKTDTRLPLGSASGVISDIAGGGDGGGGGGRDTSRGAGQDTAKKNKGKLLTVHNGTPICNNWSNGHCGDTPETRKDRNGQDCKLAHVCKFCPGAKHRLKDCTKCPAHLKPKTRKPKASE